jgi:hypothetical protein
MTDEKKEFLVPIPKTTVTTTTTAFRTAALISSPPVCPDDVLLPEVTEPKLVILKYEFEQYFMMRWMAEHPHPQPVCNAITESAVVHARNLCNFFCSFGDPGDIRLHDIFDTTDPVLSKLKKELKDAYTKKIQTGIKPQDSFNRFVAHMTSEREKCADRYDYGDEFSAIDPILLELREKIVRAHFNKKQAP